MSKNEITHIRIAGNVSYTVPETHIEKFEEEANGEQPNIFKLMTFSSYAICLNTGEVLKDRKASPKVTLKIGRLT